MNSVYLALIVLFGICQCSFADNLGGCLSEDGAYYANTWFIVYKCAIDVTERQCMGDCTPYPTGNLLGLAIGGGFGLIALMVLTCCCLCPYCPVRICMTKNNAMYIPLNERERRAMEYNSINVQ